MKKRVSPPITNTALLIENFAVQREREKKKKRKMLYAFHFPSLFVVWGEKIATMTLNAGDLGD